MIDLKNMRLEEAFAKLKVHELRLKERNPRDEEQALLSRAFNKSQMNQRGSSSRGKGREMKGKGKYCSAEVDRKKKKKQFDESKVKCYNCQKLGHFSYECELPKRDKSKGKEKILIA